MTEGNVGYATMQVIPSMRGIDGMITRELARTMPGAGQNAGRQLGGGMTAGVTEVIGGASSRTATMVKGLVTGGFVAAGAATAAFVASSIGAASRFEERLSAVGAVSGATGTQLDSLRAKALELGAETAFSASESASAMEELVKAGIPVQGVLNGAADATVALAAAGGVALPEAAAIAANAMNQFGLAASDLPGIADQIAGAANASAIDVSDFGLSMSQAGAVANLVGLSFDDTALAITAMGNAGIKGSDAGTSLKTFLTNLNPSTEKATNLMRSLGIITEESGNRFFTASGEVKSMSEISDVLAESLRGQTKEQQLAALSTLFGSDAIRAASVIAGEGAAGFDQLAASVGKVGAEEVAGKRLDNLKGDLEALGGSVETLQIKTGSLATKGLRAIVQGATEFVNLLADPPSMGFLDVLADGAERLRPAWDDLVDTGDHLVTILGLVWDTASPAATALAAVGGGAVVGAITVTADVLERVLGLIADNEGAVRLLVVGLGGLVAVKGVALLATAFDALALKAYTAVGAIESSAAAAALSGLAAGAQMVGSGFVLMGTNVRAGLAMVNSGAATATASISAMQLGVFAVGAAAVVMFHGVQKAHDIAKRQIDDLKPPDFDDRSIDAVVGYQQALGEAYIKANEAKDGTNDFLAVVKGSAQLLTPMENSIIDNAVASGDLGKAFDVAADAADRLLKSYNTAAGELGMTGAQVEAWVMKLDLPIEVVNKPKALAEAVGEAANAAENGTPVTDALATSYGVLADQTSNSTDKLKAWKDMVDGIVGAPLDVFEANTAMAESLATLSETIGGSWDRTLDENTEAGRKNRDVMAAAASQILATSEAYGNTYGVDAANMVLAANRDRLIESGVAAGISRGEMESYVAQLGLTPENVETIIRATGVEGARDGVRGLQRDLDGLDGRVVTTTIAIRQALQSLGSTAPPGMQNAERQGGGRSTSRSTVKGMSASDFEVGRAYDGAALEGRGRGRSGKSTTVNMLTPKDDRAMVRDLVWALD